MIVIMEKKMRKLTLLFSGLILSFGLLSGIKTNEVAQVKAETTTRCGVEAEWSQWFNSSKLPSGGYYYLETDVVLTKSYLSKSISYIFRFKRKNHNLRR